MAHRIATRPPTHPGEILREDILPALNMPVMAAAKRLGISRQTLHRILACTLGITPAMALRLGKFCANEPELWLNLQQSHDLWHAEQDMVEELAMIQTAKAPLKPSPPAHNPVPPASPGQRSTRPP